MAGKLPQISSPRVLRRNACRDTEVLRSQFQAWARLGGAMQSTFSEAEWLCRKTGEPVLENSRTLYVQATLHPFDLRQG